MTIIKVWLRSCSCCSTVPHFASLCLAVPPSSRTPLITCSKTVLFPMTNPIIRHPSTCYSVMAFSSQPMRKYLYILHMEAYEQSRSDIAKASPLNYSPPSLPVKQLCTQTTHILSPHNFDRLNLLFHRQVALVFNPTQPPLPQNTENMQWQQRFPKCVS